MIEGESTVSVKQEFALANDTHPAASIGTSTAREAHFTALRYFAHDGTDHRSHKGQGSMIRRYIIWRNRHADDTRLRQIIARANVA